MQIFLKSFACLNGYIVGIVDMQPMKLKNETDDTEYITMCISLYMSLVLIADLLVKRM